MDSGDLRREGEVVENTASAAKPEERTGTGQTKLGGRREPNQESKELVGSCIRVSLAELRACRIPYGKLRARVVTGTGREGTAARSGCPRKLAKGLCLI